MIAGETELILHEDFNPSTYDRQYDADMEYDDFWIFSSKAKRAARKAKRSKRKAGRIATRTARKNDPRRIAKRARTKGFFSSLGGGQGIGGAIDALLRKPELSPSIPTEDSAQDFELSMGEGEPEKEVNTTTLYLIVAGVVVAGVVGIAVLKNKNHQ